MKKIVVFIVVGVLAACSPEKSKSGNAEAESYESIHGEEGNAEAVVENAASARGLGEVTSVPLNTPLEQERVGRGKAIYDMKCSACHKLTDQRIVGPGWKDVTKRRQPEWIMNMITNVDVMLEKDPEALKLLELCLMRMPNQNVSIGDARDVLEFMRKNDGEN